MTTSTSPTMSSAFNRPASGSARSLLKRLWLPALVLVLATAAVLDTKVVRIGSQQDQRAGAFSPEAWGRKNFPTLRTSIEGAAVDAKALAAAIAEDKAAAGEKYGKPGSVGPIFAVKFSGTAGELKSGLLTVAVDGLPAGLTLRLQTGPAINGTDVRDATGSVAFGQFTNQIEYQDAGSALNNEVKAQVLAGLDREQLPGKRIEGVGVFQLINPNGWLLTPVRLKVQ